MAIKDYFFNAIKENDTYDRIYNAEDVTSYLDMIVGNGVFPTPSTQLQVQVSSGMAVKVNAGQGWINGHKMISTSDIILDVEQSDVLLSRVDNVVFYVDHTQRAMGVEVKKGTPVASNPQAPALVRNARRYELCLATINVNKQTTNITAAMIHDTRGNSELCGYVTGLIRQVDTTTLFDQWQDSFDTWFDSVKDDLVTATLIRKYEAVHITTLASESTFDVKEFIPQYAWELDILEVRINGLSLTNQEYTKDYSTITLTTPITEIGTPIEFVIYKSVDGSDAETVVDLVYELQTEMDHMFDASFLYSAPNGEFPEADVEITPTKKLSECQHGWLLTFSGYNASSGSVRNIHLQTVCVPKLSVASNGVWTGQSMTFQLVGGYNTSTEEIVNAIKQFQIYDDRIVSGANNATGNNRNVVLRNIQEY